MSARVFVSAGKASIGNTVCLLLLPSAFKMACLSLGFFDFIQPIIETYSQRSNVRSKYSIHVLGWMRKLFGVRSSYFRKGIKMLKY